MQGFGVRRVGAAFGGSGAGPVAVAVGRGDLVAVSGTTVATRCEASKLPVALSGRNAAPGLPNAAMSGDGSLAVVTWTDDFAQAAFASVLQAGVWARQNLGAAYWGGTVAVAAGGGQASAGWARAVGGNPNAAQLVGRGTQ